MLLALVAEDSHGRSARLIHGRQVGRTPVVIGRAADPLEPIALNKEEQRLGILPEVPLCATPFFNQVTPTPP